MFYNNGKKHERVILWAMPISAWSGKRDENPSFKKGDKLEAIGTPRCAHPMFAKIDYELRGRPVVKLGMVDTIYQYQSVTWLLEDLKGSDRNDVYAPLEDAGGWLLETRANTPIKYGNYAYAIA